MLLCSTRNIETSDSVAYVSTRVTFKIFVVVLLVPRQTIYSATIDL